MPALPFGKEVKLVYMPYLTIQSLPQKRRNVSSLPNQMFIAVQEGCS
jgi:hypothetical protein